LGGTALDGVVVDGSASSHDDSDADDHDDGKAGAAGE
jgi:hypothetical protein